MPINKSTFNKTAGHPLQTWEWGEFRKKAGNEVVRFDFGQVTLHQVPFTNFKVGAFIKGPRPTKQILERLKKLARTENLIFIKLEPNFPVSIDGRKLASKETKGVLNLLRDSRAVLGRTLFTPTTFWLDLTKSEEEILSSFHSKTRYNIRLAKKRGVEVVEDNSKKAFEKYIKLTRETIERQGFYAHSEKYHRLMWKYLHQSPSGPIARLLTARYKNQVITTWIVFVWKDTLYYPYGASSAKYKNVMANNLMMWEAIRLGKRLGLKTFDLWGREPGKGFTRFKEGYRPQVIEFLGTWDLITSPLYYPYRVVELIRWLLLRTRSKLAFAKPKF